MATLVTDLRRYEVALDFPAHAPAIAGKRADPFTLRPLPNEDVYFFSKTIDNARLQRQADPLVVRQCWGLSAKFATVLLLGIVLLLPKLGHTLLGYKISRQQAIIEQLKQEEEILLVINAALKSPKRLAAINNSRIKLKPVQPGQVQHLDPPQGRGSGVTAAQLH